MLPLQSYSADPTESNMIVQTLRLNKKFAIYYLKSKMHLFSSGMS